MGARLEAIEYYHPEKVITTLDLEKDFPGYSFSKFEHKIGIRKRYVAARTETALDLAVAACDKLFLRIDLKRIDYVIFCSQSPEYLMPSSACILQARLNLNNNIGAFDINLGCSGFTYGISMAKGLIESEQATCVLLITADTYSKYIHPRDRSNRAIFGDAAAACIISYSEENKVFKFKFGTDGTGYKHLIVKNGGSRYPISEKAEELIYGKGNVYTDNHLYMNGPEVFKFTSRVIPPFIEEVLAYNALSKLAIDQYVFHQANAHMLKVMRDNLDIEDSKFYINLEDGGNTVSSTVPIALKQYTNGLMRKTKELIMVAGFGVGLSWSAGLIEVAENL